MAASDNPTSNDLPKRWRKRRLVIIILAVVLLAATPLTYIWYCNSLLAQKLQNTIDELDRSDPGWRLEEIEAARPPLPDEANMALKVNLVQRNMPIVWGYTRTQSFEDPYFVSAPVQLSAKQISFVRAELNRVAFALAQARRFKDYKEGRFKINWSEDGTSDDEDQIQCVRQVACLLHYDVLLLAQEKKPATAWQSCAALYALNKSIGNADNLLLLLIRIAVQTYAINAMERVLGQGEVSDDALAATQKMLERDLDEPLLLTGLRGERACKHRFFVALRNGRVSSKQVAATVGANSPQSSYIVSCIQTGDSWLNCGLVSAGHAGTLRFMTKVADAAKLPRTELVKTLDELEQNNRKGRAENTVPYLAAMQIPAILRVAEADVRRHVQIQCAIAGLASERFRLQHGRWPKSLDEMLKHKLLSKIPIDPHSGKPLHLKQCKNGLVVFGKGLEITDGYAGQLIDNPAYEGPPYSFLAFHLWNADKRRQLPPR